jgi:hypothetical protein
MGTKKSRYADNKREISLLDFEVYWVHFWWAEHRVGVSPYYYYCRHQDSGPTFGAAQQ